MNDDTDATSAPPEDELAKARHLAKGGWEVGIGRDESENWFIGLKRGDEVVALTIAEARAMGVLLFEKAAQLENDRDARTPRPRLEIVR